MIFIKANMSASLFDFMSIGGILHFTCTHGFVYYLNFLKFKESARDYVDGILSFKRFPTVFICDIAGQVASHLSNRTESKYFQDDLLGRLERVTDENMEDAEGKTLEVEPDWIRLLKVASAREKNVDLEDDRFTARHPITNTSQRFILYDRFHQKNQTRREELLRSLDICPELRALINSSASEQFNRCLKNILYSTNELKQSTFLFMVRTYVKMRNMKINNAFTRKIQSCYDHSLGVGHMGFLTLEDPGKFLIFLK